jgi:hypothetical protein
MPGKTRKRSASVKRGGYYGASGAIAPGAMEWGRGSEMGDFSISTRGANAQYGAARKKRSASTKRGGRKTKRSASTKRGGKKGKRSASVKRGGSAYGAVAASYQGTGSRGIMDVVPVTTKYPPFGPAAGGAFNNAGAQPGSGFGSFIRAH